MRTLTRIIPPRARSRRGLALSVSFGALAGLIVVVQAWLLAAAISGAFLGGAGLPEVEGPLAASAVLRAGSSRRPEPSPGAPPPAIRFEGVRYAYGPDRSPALDGLTIALPAGATVALLGPSGSGKTTAARLLLRFLEPDRGARSAREASVSPGGRPKGWPSPARTSRTRPFSCSTSPRQIRSCALGESSRPRHRC